MSAGYLVVRPVERTPFMNASLVPERLWTASDCLAEIVPHTGDLWELYSAELDEAARLAAATRFGVPPGKLRALIDWATHRFDADFVWPHVFVTLAAAREYLAAFVPADSDATPLGLALQREDAETFLGELSPGDRGVGLARMLELRLAPQEGGMRLGSEVLGLEHGGGLHSSLCNSLEGVFSERWGTRPNAWGLWDDHEWARRCAEYAGSEESGAEPVPWRAWMLTQYPRE